MTTTKKVQYLISKSFQPVRYRLHSFFSLGYNSESDGNVMVVMASIPQSAVTSKMPNTAAMVTL